MVALLVRLKLTLLRNSLRRSVWQTIALILAAAFGVGFTLLGVSLLVGARGLPVEAAGTVVVLGGALLVTGWAVLPVLFFGTDETLDPARFALLTVPARRLLPGLLAAAAVGVPGVVTSLIALTTVATWSRGVLTAGVALVAAVLGVLLCLVASRVVTSALARTLASRRFQDVASMILVLGLLTFAFGSSAAGAVLARSGDQLADRLPAAVAVVGWTPLGWVWSAPVEAAEGQPVAAVVKLALTVALIVLLLQVWVRLLDRALTSPLVATGAGPRSGDGRPARWERLLPSGPVGAVAGRSLRYLRRDPRYVVLIASSVLAPVAIVVSNTVLVGVDRWVVWMPVLLGFVVAVSSCQDTSYDGSAHWTQMSTGISGEVDRAGRALAQLCWSGPVLLVSTVGAAAATGAWDLLPGALGLASGTLLCGVGAAAWVSALWQGAVPPPGANPFGSGSGGSAASFIAVTVMSLLLFVLVLPLLALAVGSIWVPWLAWILPLVGPVWGLLALGLGVRLGGRHLEAHWPEVLERVSTSAR